jgi:hypothetical protein
LKVGTLPVKPDHGIAVAVIEPVPVALRDAPEPKIIAADVLVPPVMAEKAEPPPVGAHAGIFSDVPLKVATAQLLPVVVSVI